jgi:hypothetical protein
MLDKQSARHEEPFFELTATGDVFEAALRNAVRTNAVSMKNLHCSITKCVVSLRDEGMQCEAVLLTMKAFIRDLAARHARNSLTGIVHPDTLMDQIVRWCISDYYAQQ